MSIIQQIREKYAAVVIGIIALSLIGFLLMDTGKANRGGADGAAEEAFGKVNGKKITRGEFFEMAKQMEDNYASQGQEIEEGTRQQIYQQVWSQLSDGTIIDQEIEKIGLVVTDKEASYHMFVSNPPEFLKQSFTDQKTGQFKGEEARQALLNLKKSKTTPQNQAQKDGIAKAMDQYNLDVLRKKYFAILQQSAYVPKWMGEKQLADNNAIASFKYVMLPYSQIVDSTIAISNDQISTFLNEHKAEYKREEETRNFNYVSFDIKPTTADSAAALNYITGLKQAFESTKDPATFLQKNNSDLPYFDGYNSKTKIQIPGKDSILAAGANTVYGPYKDGNSWVLSKIIDIKTFPDSVKARHILIGTVDPQTRQPKMADSTAKQKIDSIKNLLTNGGNFAALALQFSDDEGSKIMGGDLGYFAQGKMVAEFNDSCFNGKVGDLKVVKTQFGYHLINITDQKGNQPNYKVAYMSKNIAPSTETVTDIVNKATLFAGNSKNIKAFEDNIAKNKYQKLLGQEVKPNDFSAPGIGNNRPLIKWIFEHNVGDVSEPFEMKDKIVVVAITAQQDAGLPAAATARPQVEPILRNEQKAKLLKAKIGTVSTLEALATAQNTTVQRADSTSFSNASIQGGGYEPKVVGAAFCKANLNKIIAPIAGNSGVYVVMPESIAAKVDANAKAADLKKQAETQMKQSLVYAAMNALRKAANVKDYRSKYL